ncbi:hypothetical protein MAHJHV53_12720 [Mycobacterium avium subsp. hominissuis]|uniref:Uncharacterized protein n=1 Tax=Mycobacterium paraffinicum TaxID=53378 RepID=A0ABP8RIX9_9MYCO|nr:Transcriptional regulator [Mycobacterium avium subsp. hominissuis TH135]
MTHSGGLAIAEMPNVVGTLRLLAFWRMQRIAPATTAVSDIPQTAATLVSDRTTTDTWSARKQALFLLFEFLLGQDSCVAQRCQFAKLGGDARD